MEKLLLGQVNWAETKKGSGVEFETFGINMVDGWEFKDHKNKRTFIIDIPAEVDANEDIERVFELITEFMINEGFEIKRPKHFTVI